ncbi:MAG: hypothetical protein OXT09_33670 [Myxococcales bacterium]|nr:hypothetical protein [Myxococcales bacterium]
MGGLQASRIGDTASSAGEESREGVRELRIDHAAFGVASKDLSRVRVEQAVMAAYRKKGECGPASIDARTVTMVRVEARSLCELDSSVELEGVKTTCRGLAVRPFIEAADPTAPPSSR